MNGEMFRDWSDSGLAIRDGLLSYLLRGGAEFDKPNIARHVRVKVPGAAVELLAQLTDQPWKQAVLLKLSVGRDSGLIGLDGPLTPSTSGPHKAERDRGLIAVTLDDLPGDLPRYIDQAFRHCTGSIPAAPTTAEADPSDHGWGDQTDPANRSPWDRWLDQTAESLVTFTRDGSWDEPPTNDQVYLSIFELLRETEGQDLNILLLARCASRLNVG